jgi:diacylglycerol kinase (ATP)
MAVNRRRKEWRLVVQLLSSIDDLNCEFRETHEAGQSVRLAAEAVNAGFDLVVAVGGDGTVNETVNGLMQAGDGSKTPGLGIIPLGSGCDFIRTLGIPRDPVQAAASLRAMRKFRIDVGRAEYLDWEGEKQVRFFVNSADVGAGGVVVKHAAKAPAIFGRRPNYLWGMISAVIAYRPKTVALQVEGRSPENIRMRNVVFANGKYFGRGFKVAPHAHLDDRLLDVVVLGDYSIPASLWHLPKMYSGTHLSLNKIRNYRTEKIHVSSEEDVLLELDGELVGTLPTTFEIVPRALHIIH